MASFGAHVKELRQKRGWTQRDLARYADIPYMTVWRIERDNHHYPRMDIAIKIAQTFGVSLDLLCGLYDREGVKLSSTAAA
jgi:transcriptional regulator with XRE-family HTH domain